jgi:hypothetical protein
MKEKNILVIYNICGIKFDNLEMWLNHVQDILNQKYSKFTVAISGCVVSDNSKKELEKLKTKYSNVVFNWIEDILPVNVTFNHTAQICTEQLREFDGYLYIASDVKFGNDTEVLQKLSYLHQNSNSAITYALVNNDHGLDGWYPEVWSDLDNLLETDHFYINIGKTANMHVALFDKEIYTKYNSQIIPDIFATHCTETTYSYLAASLGKKFVIHNKDIMLGHIGFADGHSIGFIGEIKYDDKLSWKHLFRSSISAEERLLSEEAKLSGFGYGEWKEVLMPGEYILHRDKTMYDEDENHIEPQKLLDFLKKAIYLSQDEFNYSDIKYQFIT